ncbi:MAG: hypothetical protein AB7N73_05485 [Gemmatimonadales bacterium]
MKGFLVLLTALGLTTGVPAASAPAPQAAPRIIMLHGGVLEERIYLTDWNENLAFMLAIAEPASPPVASIPDSAPHVEIAMFWYGPTWEPYVQDTSRLRTLDPKDAQRSRLHLGHDGRPPVIAFPVGPTARGIDSTGLKILAKYQVVTTR